MSVPRLRDGHWTPLKEVEWKTWGSEAAVACLSPSTRGGVEIHNGTEIFVFSTILNFLMFWALGVCFRVSRVCWNIEYTCVFLSLLDMFSNILTKHLLTFIVCLKWNSSFGLFNSLHAQKNMEKLKIELLTLLFTQPCLICNALEV